MTPVQGAAYARISMDRRGEEMGVQRQTELNRSHADKCGIDLVHELVDNDVSAMKPGTFRPGYAQLLELVRAGKVNAVVVYQSSRLWRNRRERLDGMELFKEHGVDVRCVRGMDLELGSASGRLIAGIEGEVNAWESEVKAERMSDEHAQSARLGHPPRGPRCFGYSPNGWELVPEEAEGVAEAFKGLLLGDTVTGLARMLNGRGLTTSRGGPWTPATVRKMLCNERYAALREYHGTLYPGKWPAIVSEAQWRAASGVINDPRRRLSDSVERKHLGTGLFLCGVEGCGAPMRAGSRGPGKRAYRCRDHAHLVRPADPIDDVVVGVVVERLSREDARDLLVDQTAPDVEALQTEATALRAHLDNLAAMLGRRVLTEAQFETANREAQADLDAVESRMQHTTRAPVLDALVSSDDVRKAWDETPLARQRAVIDSLFTVMILPAGRGKRFFDPETVQIRWK